VSTLQENYHTTAGCVLYHTFIISHSTVKICIWVFLGFPRLHNLEGIALSGIQNDTECDEDQSHHILTLPLYKQNAQPVQYHRLFKSAVYSGKSPGSRIRPAAFGTYVNSCLKDQDLKGIPMMDLTRTDDNSGHES
jgi:hypothetical protein